jgi:hypothetical protein
MRPTNCAPPCHHPAWPGRPANYSIPLDPALPEDCQQSVVNDFLTRLEASDAFPPVPGANARLTSFMSESERPGILPTTRHQRPNGVRPTVFDRQVSCVNGVGRRAHVRIARPLRSAHLGRRCSSATKDTARRSGRGAAAV